MTKTNKTESFKTVDASRLDNVTGGAWNWGGTSNWSSGTSNWSSGSTSSWGKWNWAK